MLLQGAALTITFVTQWTLVRFLSRVKSHMNLQISRLTKGVVTYATSVRFIATVNSAVHSKPNWCCESFATNSTCKRSLSWMTSPVYCQMLTTLKTFAAFGALVFTCVNNHMLTQDAQWWKMYSTLSARIAAFSSVYSAVNFQILFPCKSFVTHSTQIRLQLVITWMLIVITAISFKLYFKGTSTCIIYTAWDIVSQKHFTSSTMLSWHSACVSTNYWRNSSTPWFDTSYTRCRITMHVFQCVSEIFTLKHGTM